MTTIKTTVILFFALVINMAAAPAFAIQLDLMPGTQTVAPADTASLDIVISGLGAGSAPSLSSYDLEITYDDALLTPTLVNIGDPGLGDQLDLFGLGSIVSVTPGVGLLSISELSLDLPSDLDLLQADNFILASLTFTTLGVGNAAVGFGNVILGDSFGLPLAADVNGATIAIRNPVNGVPEPMTWALLLPGLAWLRGRRFRV